MGNEKSAFDESRFDGLIRDENWLGAWTYLKTTVIDRTEEGIRIGILANGLQHALTDARHADDKEKMSYLRSLLAWMLRDYPGLASLYREQVRPNNLPGIPDGLQDIWRDFNDILAGRKTLDENFKERMRDASSHLAGEGIDANAFATIARDAETEIRKGVDGVRDFLGSLWGSPTPPVDPKKPETEQPSRKIKIQDADDPLPENLHMANPPEEKPKVK